MPASGRSSLALAGSSIGIPVGLAMAFYFINVLRPLFFLDPPYIVPLGSLSLIVGSVLAADGSNIGGGILAGEQAEGDRALARRMTDAL